jgi:hypothetical protein
VRSGPGYSTLTWVALALVGLAVAVGVSYAASQLSKPKVGLTSEPISHVRELAPEKPTRGPNGSPERTTPTTPAAPTDTTSVPPPQGSEEERGDDD